MAKKDTGADNIDPFLKVTVNMVEGLRESEKKTDHGIIVGLSRIGKGQEAYDDLRACFSKRTVIIDPMDSWKINKKNLPAGINPEIKKFRTVRGLIAALEDKQKRIIKAHILARKTGKKVPPDTYYFIYRLVVPYPDKMMMEHLYAKLFEIGHIHLILDECKRYISKYIDTEKIIYVYSQERCRFEKRASLWNDLISSGSHSCISTCHISTDFLDFPAFLRRQISYVKIFRQGREEEAAAAAGYFTATEVAKYGKRGQGLMELAWRAPTTPNKGECVPIWYRGAPGFSANQMAPGYRY